MRLDASALVGGQQSHVEAPQLIGAHVTGRRLINDGGVREIVAAVGTALKVRREGLGLLRPGSHQVITVGPGREPPGLRLLGRVEQVALLSALRVQGDEPAGPRAERVIEIPEGLEKIVPPLRCGPRQGSVEGLPLPQCAGGGGGAISRGQPIHRRSSPHLRLVATFSQRDLDSFLGGFEQLGPKLGGLLTLQPCLDLRSSHRAQRWLHGLHSDARATTKQISCGFEGTSHGGGTTGELLMPGLITGESVTHREPREKRWNEKRGLSPLPRLSASTRADTA
ncbi:hypothetical protein DB31_8220 [Hyalangium minutum]|uniref:Uncharacterized protein n=1 Tax=Hyalangium minutum TaxID=394096 RepID=A0A085WJ74_9BACT|nr:hypothetical protein DB31_8220 [Hyalangium minutum]